MLYVLDTCMSKSTYLKHTVLMNNLRLNIAHNTNDFRDTEAKPQRQHGFLPEEQFLLQPIFTDKLTRCHNAISEFSVLLKCYH